MRTQESLLSSPYGENTQVRRHDWVGHSSLAALIKPSVFFFSFRLSGRVFPRCDGHKGSLVGRGDAQPAGHLGEGLGAARPQGLLEEPSHFHADRSEDGREGLHEDRGAVPDQDQTAEEIFPPEQQVGVGTDSPSVFVV